MTTPTIPGLPIIGGDDTSGVVYHAFGSALDAAGVLTWYCLTSCPGSNTGIELYTTSPGLDIHFNCSYRPADSTPECIVFDLVGMTGDTLTVYPGRFGVMALASRHFGAQITGVSLDDCDVTLSRRLLRVTGHPVEVTDSALEALITRTEACIGLAGDVSAFQALEQHLADIMAPTASPDGEIRSVPRWCLLQLRQLVANVWMIGGEQHRGHGIATRVVERPLTRMALHLQTYRTASAARS